VAQSNLFYSTDFNRFYIWNFCTRGWISKLGGMKQLALANSVNSFVSNAVEVSYPNWEGLKLAHWSVNAFADPLFRGLIYCYKVIFGIF
jgi:hypothetical protein